MDVTTPVRSSEEKLSGGAGTITLKTWWPSKPAGEPVFLLPNGYGLLPYAESVCEELAGRGKMVYSLDLRGQGGNPITDTWTMHIIGPPEGADENNLSMGDIDGDGKIDIISPEFIYFQNSADSWTAARPARPSIGCGRWADVR